MGLDYYNILKVNRNASDEDLIKSKINSKTSLRPMISLAILKSVRSTISTAKRPSNPARFRRPLPPPAVLSATPTSTLTLPFASIPGMLMIFMPNCLAEPTALALEEGELGFIEMDFFRATNVAHFGSSTGARASRKALVVENLLSCCLEELYKGAKKKMKICRTIDDASGLGIGTIF